MFDLYQIKDPSFIKKLSKKELETLAKDIRAFLLENISKTGGHLASNLGIVEITIALHYVFDSPNDMFLFDVGHQSYVHKILTGRAKDFATLRQLDGLSGYINRQESIHDIWESGHSSTSISAQAGLIEALKKENDNHHVISIIGDASISNGIAFEGLNYLGQNHHDKPIVILNDNKMGIDRSVGALSKFLNKSRGTKLGRNIHYFMVKYSPIWLSNLIHKVKKIFKNNIFTNLGFDYFGAYEGNDVWGLIKILKKIKNNHQPVLVHLITRKGQGYLPAMQDMTFYHGVSSFDLETGKIINQDNKTSFSKIVADQLLKLREEYAFSIINPAMVSGSKMEAFKNKYPNDFYDVGIAEEHAVIMACGLALKGHKVVVSLYSTFAQRAYDQLLNDAARQNLNIVVTLDRAGVVGEDGETHQGIYDLAMLRSMPHMVIAMGKDSAEIKGLLRFGLIYNDGLFALRFPKHQTEDLDEIKIDDMSWVIEREGKKGIIITYGDDINRILNLNLDAYVINARFIRPLDKKMLDYLAKLDLPILIYEQVIEASSLSEGISAYYQKNNIKIKKIVSMNFANSEQIKHGKIEDVLVRYHLGDKDILEAFDKLCD